VAKLSLRVKLGFGVGDLGGNMYFTLIGFYLMYYLTDVVRLPAGLAGIAFMIGKIWDAVTDPVTGYVSDRTVTRFGRRRPFMAVGAILLFGSMALMFSSPAIGNPAVLFAVVTVLFCLLSLAYTLVNIPYAALLPELTNDFDERTTLTGYRMSFAVVGTLVGAGAVLPLVDAFGGNRSGWLGMGVVTGFLMLASAFGTVFAVREPKRERAAEGIGFFRTCIEVLGLKVFLKALLPWTFFIAGTSVIQGSLIYFFRNIYGDEGLFQIALLFLLVTSLVFIPVWLLISRRLGKRTCYIIGISLMSVGVLLFAFLGGPGRIVFAYIVMIGAGIGLSTHYVMPHSILPDVVEYDAVKNGVRREGIFSSLWTFSSKIGQAVALGITGLVLQIADYAPETVLDATAVWGIRLLCGPIPVVFYIVGIVILTQYPITRTYYNRMMETRTIPAEKTTPPGSR
jgi:GPH family glycoside/pentoside/hexuronide:cation symporter